MSAGGDGIVDLEPLVEVARPAEEALTFIPRRFKAGGRLNITDSEGIRNTFITTCVLCGGVMVNEEVTVEHPLPQWLHRFAGDVGERKARAFQLAADVQPTWRQLCLDSHKQCNSIFARKVEDPAISGIKTMVQGGRVTGTQLDAIFDWLDKIKSASAHMGVALRGHDLRLGYDMIAFPNLRVGAFDRLAIVYRLTDKKVPLDLWDCLNEGFLTTPSALVLRISDLVIVYGSNNYLLSQAFGLGFGKMENGTPRYQPGSGTFAPGFGSRKCRIPIAKIFAQPMRRQHFNEGLLEQNVALQANGDGKVYELSGNRWVKVKSTEFSNLPKLQSEIGQALASLEAVEWILLSKEQDYARYGSEGSFFMRSYPELNATKLELINMITALRRGIGLPESDRD